MLPRKALRNLVLGLVAISAEVSCSFPSVLSQNAEILSVSAAASGGAAGESWAEQSFADFRDGVFEDAGSDLYVSASGVLQRIHRHDINADGAVDLVFCNTHDTDNQVEAYVYWGGPQGFEVGRRTELDNSGAHSAIIADLNGDSRDDLVLPGYHDGDTYRLNSYLYLGRENGLDTERRLSLPTMAARDAAAADFNRDGYLDLFLAVPWVDVHYEAVEIDGRIYWGDKEGFDSKRSSPLPCRGSVAVEASDLNGDGYPELILANLRENRNTSTTSFVYWNGPDGMSREHRTELPTEGATAVSVGDVNGDDKPDLAFASSAGTSTPIYLNGPGGFSVQRAIQIPQGSSGISLADADADGDLDAILASESTVAVYLNQGGRFPEQPVQSLPAHEAKWVTAANLNADEFPDLVVSNHSDGSLHSCSSYIYWGSSHGYASQNRVDLPTHGAMKNAVGDLNGDGYPDVVFSNTVSGHTHSAMIPSYVYYGDNQGYFSPEQRGEVGTVGALDVATADLDENGFPELLFAAQGRRRGSRLEGSSIHFNGPDGLDPEAVYIPVIGGRGVAISDLNLDGHLDLILTNPFRHSEPEYPAHSTFVFWGSSQGYDFGKYHTFSTPHAYRFTLADLDRDGFLDMAAGRMYENRLSVYWGNRQGRFSSNRRIDLPTFLCTSVNVADLDGDGFLDLIANNKGSRDNAEEPALIYWGSAAQEPSTREGIFLEERRTELPTSAGSRSVVGDFNRDGKLDICITNYLGNTSRNVPSYIYWGDGRRFSSLHRSEIPIEAGSGGQAADFDRDGWLDIALISHKSGSDHKTLSKVFWGDPGGFLVKPPTGLPSLGAHQLQNRNIGHVADRGPGVAYRSSIHHYQGLPLRLRWKGDTPGRTSLTFQVRAAKSRDELGNLGWSPPDQGPSIDLSTLKLPREGWIQYRVDFISPDGGLSPTLREVSVDFR